MIIIPAVDIQGGKVVRLTQGKFNEATIYFPNPEEAAQKWETLGAQRIHVVDLDGAKTGEIKNWDSIERVIKSVKIPVQVGGGIRKKEDVEKLLGLGAKYIVIGTKAVSDKVFVQQIVSQWQGQVFVSIDTSHGAVLEKGWLEVTTKKTGDLAKEMQDIGVKQVVFTDISRDGTLAGPNLPEIKRLLSIINIPLIVAGGVSTIDDLRKLKELEKDGLAGVIIGKALYEGKIDFQEALKLC